MIGHAEMGRIGSGVTPPGIDRADRRRNLPARIGTIHEHISKGRVGCPGVSVMQATYLGKRHDGIV